MFIKDGDINDTPIKNQHLHAFIFHFLHSLPCSLNYLLTHSFTHSFSQSASQSMSIFTSRSSVCHLTMALLSSIHLDNFSISANQQKLYNIKSHVSACVSFVDVQNRCVGYRRLMLAILHLY